MHYDFVPLGITIQAVKVPHFLVKYLGTIPLQETSEKTAAVADQSPQAAIKGRVLILLLAHRSKPKEQVVHENKACNGFILYLS